METSVRSVLLEQHEVHCKRYDAKSSPSSQLVTIPCSMGYLRVRIPLLDCASSPTYESFCPIPTMTPVCLGRPTMEGKTARGASNPALHIPDPLSTTYYIACT